MANMEKSNAYTCLRKSANNACNSIRLNNENIVAKYSIRRIKDTLSFQLTIASMNFEHDAAKTPAQNIGAFLSGTLSIKNVEFSETTISHLAELVEAYTNLIT